MSAPAKNQRKNVSASSTGDAPSPASQPSPEQETRRLPEESLAADDDAPRARAFRNEGHRQLCALSDSSASIGRAIDRSKATVSAWRTGAKLPDREARQKLAAVYPSIRERAWDEHSRTEEPSQRRSASLPAPDGRPTSLQDVESLIEAIRALCFDAKLLPGERLKATGELRALLRDRARLMLEAAEAAEDLEDRVGRHPKLRRVLEVALHELRAHPAALTAVTRALDAERALEAP